MFEGKKILITGGTGSFGEAVLKRFLDTDVGEIRVFSRDEKKQDDMRNRYRNRKLSFYIGDVRSPQSCRYAMSGIDLVFHAAALKQVPSCEFFPMEAIQTNSIGADNVMTAALDEGVGSVVVLSTDKAAYPVNAMGMSKALMEKLMIAKSRFSTERNTVFSATRYGNVMGSRGSVIPLFVRQVLTGQPLTVTNPDMTRFVMSIEEAVHLVVYAFSNAAPGDIFVRKAPAATLSVLVDSIKKVFDVPNHPVNVIGTRHGEKLYETLLTREEMALAKDQGEYYRVPAETRDLNYGIYVDTGDEVLGEFNDYHSHNTVQLDVDGMAELLLTIKSVQDGLKGILPE